MLISENSPATSFMIRYRTLVVLKHDKNRSIIVKGQVATSIRAGVDPPVVLTTERAELDYMRYRCDLQDGL